MATLSKKIFLITLLVFSLITISACQVTELTPQNVDPIANDIQAKYDSISAFEARLYQLRSDDSIKAGRFAAKKPSQVFELVFWEGDVFLSSVEVCSGQQSEHYSAETSSISISQKDCANRVDKHFEVFDRIKELASFSNTIEEITVHYDNGDYKDVSFFKPSSDYDSSEFKIVETSSAGYSVAERLTSGQTEGEEGVKIIFTDTTNHQVELIFLKNNYQLIKSQITNQEGNTETVYYSDLQFNNDVNDRYFTMPTIDEINALK